MLNFVHDNMILMEQIAMLLIATLLMVRLYFGPQGLKERQLGTVIEKYKDSATSLIAFWNLYQEFVPDHALRHYLWPLTPEQHKRILDTIDARIGMHNNGIVLLPPETLKVKNRKANEYHAPIRGQATFEYALLLGLVALVCIGVLTHFGLVTCNLFYNTIIALGSNPGPPYSVCLYP